MNHIDSSVESRRLPEKHKFSPGRQTVVHPFDPLEEDHLDLTSAVTHPRAHSAHRIKLQFIVIGHCFLGGSSAIKLDMRHTGPDLYISHIRTRISYTYK